LTISQLSLDQNTRTALEAFHIRILNRFGERLRGLVLFGSRARGDHRPDSDADVAVFLDRIDDLVADYTLEPIPVTDVQRALTEAARFIEIVKGQSNP
jgi:predicted nucleotidyltransferase